MHPHRDHVSCQQARNQPPVTSNRSTPELRTSVNVCRVAMGSARQYLEELRSISVRRLIILATMVSLLAAAPALAGVRILSSPGGEVREYLNLFEGFRQSGERVVIDGPCYSACTLVL